MSDPSKSRQMPPVPPANRSAKGPGDKPRVDVDDAKPDQHPDNPDQQGSTAAVRQNTTNRVLKR